MWKSKKFIIIGVVVAVVVLAGSVIGVAFAQAAAPTASDNVSLLARVTAILNGQGNAITQQQLQSAFDLARQQERDVALDNYLKKLVAENKITQAQADQYRTWLKARPNINVPGATPGFGMHRFAGPGGMGGMMRGWNKQNVPGAPTPTK